MLINSIRSSKETSSYNKRRINIAKYDKDDTPNQQPKTSHPKFSIYSAVFQDGEMSYKISSLRAIWSRRRGVWGTVRVVLPELMRLGTKVYLYVPGRGEQDIARINIVRAHVTRYENFIFESWGGILDKMKKLCVCHNGFACFLVINVKGFCGFVIWVVVDVYYNKIVTIYFIND